MSEDDDDEPSGSGSEVEVYSPNGKLVDEDQSKESTAKKMDPADLITMPESLASKMDALKLSENGDDLKADQTEPKD